MVGSEVVVQGLGNSPPTMLLSRQSTGSAVLKGRLLASRYCLVKAEPCRSPQQMEESKVMAASPVAVCISCLQLVPS